MREIKIPKSFMLFGQKITVRYDPELLYKEDEYGQASFRTNEIVLQPQTEAAPLPPDKAEEVFLHELVHFVLEAAGDDEFDPPLYAREELVDRIASLLHQVLKTAEYEDDAEWAAAWEDFENHVGRNLKNE